MPPVVDSWDSGSAYEAYVGRWSRKIGREFLTWLAPPHGAAWLDLGCGTGSFTAQILGQCSPKSIVGVDPSGEFLAAARGQIADDRVEFQPGDAEQTHLDAESVDLAVSGFVLNFAPDPGKAMLEQLRVLKPGGTLAAYVWDYAGHAQFIRAFWDAAVGLKPEAQDLDEGVRFPICRPAPLRELFESAGLVSVDVAQIDVPTAFETFDDYWTPFLSGVGPAPGYCMTLNEADREALRARLEHTLPTDMDGRILLAARAWAIRGTKQLRPVSAA